ncbi:MAG: ABC transporter permease [Acidilobaceae archaeon]|nr:ABC transporter permease [Acidilobaceae archaeon]
MSLLAKSAVRSVVSRRLESLAVTLVVMIAVMGVSSLNLARENFSQSVYSLTLSVTGEVLVIGSFSPDVVRELLSLDSVREARDLRVTFGAVRQEGELVLVFVMGHQSFTEAFRAYVLEGALPSSREEAVLYTALRAPSAEEVKPSERVSLVLYDYERGGLRSYELKVVGTAKGFNHIGRSRQALIVHEDLLKEVLGERVTYLSLYSAGDAKRAAAEALKTLEERGSPASWYFINTREENAVVRIVDGVTTLFSLPIVLLLISVPLISASVGSAFVARDFKLIGVMKALGAGPLELFQQYSLPWLLRGMLGLVLGIALTPFAAKEVYVRAIGDDELGNALYEVYGFTVYPEVIALYALVTALLLFLGSLVPFFLALRVQPLEAITFSGLYAGGGARVIPPLPGGLRLIYFLRDMAARFWKIAALVLLLSSLLGLSAASAMIASGAEEISERARDRSYNPMDLYIYVNDLEQSLRVVDTLERELKAGAERYHITYLRTFSGAVEGLGFVPLVASARGDPTLEFPLIEGRYPSTGEAVVSQSLARLKGLKVGDVLEFRDGLGRVHELKVVGVSRALHLGGSYVLVSPDQYLTIARVSGPSAYGGLAAAAALGGEDGRELVRRLESALSIQVEAEDREALARSVRSTTGLVRGASYSITLVLLIVSVIVTASVVVGDVLARVREIAVMKALGMKPLDFSLMSLLQAVLATLISIPPALLIGYLVAERLARGVATFVPYVEPKVGIEALLNPLSVMALFSLYLSLFLATWLVTRRVNVVRSISDI